MTIQMVRRLVIELVAVALFMTTPAFDSLLHALRDSLAALGGSLGNWPIS